MEEQLHKLSCINSEEETLEQLLCTLWSTRKTGLRPPEKSHFQTLLQLPSLSDLDPVLVCLRSLIRKSVCQNFTSDDLLKLFPPDLPLDLQSNLLLCFQKNLDRWKEDVSQEHVTVTPSITQSQWPRQDDSLPSLARCDFGTPTMPLVSELCASAFFQCDTAPSHDSENLPSFKSLTWKMENRGSSPADRVAIISLKLHDDRKSPSGETEVTFQLTRDTLEAMLRSITYISEQLNAVETSSGPANKKQKQ